MQEALCLRQTEASAWNIIQGNLTVVCVLDVLDFGQHAAFSSTWVVRPVSDVSNREKKCDSCFRGSTFPLSCPQSLIVLIESTSTFHKTRSCYRASIFDKKRIPEPPN